MTSLAAHERRPARPLVGLLSLVAAATLLLSAAPAEAGSNWFEGHCSLGYNYADASSGYLYASTTADINAWPEPCAIAYVWILNGGCGGQVLAYAEDAFGYATTSYVLDPAYWFSPASHHMADWNRDYRCLPYIY